MAIQRISFNDSGNYTGAFTFILNPSRLDLKASNRYEMSNVLDGEQVKQNAYFDNRELSMTWNRIPSDYHGFSNMLATLQSYIGELKYMHPGDAEYRVVGTGWNLIRVIDLKISPITAGGKLKLNVELIVMPVQV